MYKFLHLQTDRPALSIFVCFLSVCCVLQLSEGQTCNPPCANGGTCIDGGTSGAYCACLPEWTGPQCQDLLPCDTGTGTDVCMNGGSCDITTGNCSCSPDFVGARCQFLRNFNTCTPMLCNDGTCVTEAGGIFCACGPFQAGAFCENTPPCSSLDPCINGGSCYDTGPNQENTCICDSRYTGVICETPLFCNPNPCQNGGTCNLEMSGIATCDCPVGFEGDRCEDKIDPCVDITCANGGTCVPDGVGFFCNCLSGFSGTLCETILIPCQSSPCRNGGTCSNLFNETHSFYMCTCPMGFSGNRCQDEIDSPCTPNNCRNGGTCMVTPENMANCQCAPGYMGARCQDEVIACTPNYCQNGGTCSLNQQGSARCQCTADYMGARCQDQVGGGGGSSGLSTEVIGIIAGTVGGVVVIVIIIIIIVCCVCRRSGKKQDKEHLRLEEGVNRPRSGSHNYTPSPTNAMVPAIPNLRVSLLRDSTKLEFPRNRLTIQEKLGSGSFAEVFKAEAVGITESFMKTTVAVKMLKATASENDKKDLSKELSLFMYLDPHPNIVNLLGCCTEKDPWYIIMEYLPNGNLQGYLRKLRTGESPESEDKSTPTKQENLAPNELLSFGVQIARGMEYLASMACIHRDLATRNILLGEGMVCKVSDFGLARDVEDGQTYEMKSQGRVPVRWMAPESLLHNTYTSQSDVWSFGILMWEIVTLGSHPYPGLSSRQVVKEITAGYRLPKPVHCSQEIYDMMQKCWSYEADERPTFKQLRGELENMLADSQGYLQMDDFRDDNYLYLEPDQATGDSLDAEPLSQA